jgi:hypothetical protein
MAFCPVLGHIPAMSGSSIASRLLPACACLSLLAAPLLHAQTHGEDRAKYRALTAPEIPVAWRAVPWEFEGAPSPTGLALLVLTLASADFEQRQRAEAELIEWGRSAAPYLEEAAASDDPELRARARRILKHLPSDWRPWYRQLHEHLAGEAATGIVSPEVARLLGQHGADVLDFDAIRDALSAAVPPPRTDPPPLKPKAAPAKPRAAPAVSDFDAIRDAFDDAGATPAKPKAAPAVSDFDAIRDAFDDAGDPDLKPGPGHEEAPDAKPGPGHEEAPDAFDRIRDAFDEVPPVVPGSAVNPLPGSDPELASILAIFSMRRVLGAERVDEALAAFTRPEAKTCRTWLGLLAHDPEGEPLWLKNLDEQGPRATEIRAWELNEAQRAFLSRGTASTYKPLRAHCRRWVAYLD